jgi:predicted secreted protein
MRISAIAATSGFSLFIAACSQPAAEPPKPEDKPVVEQTAAPDPFLNAVNFACEGGGTLDVVFDYGQDQSSILTRIDGGPGLILSANPDSQSMPEFKDATTTLATDGATIRWASGGATKVCNIVTRALPPPAVAGVVQALTIEDAGKSVQIKVGETISVALSGVPTAGYLWAASAPPAFVKASEGPGGATSTAQFTPGFAGGNHWEVVVFEAIAPGEAEITLAQRRPWEDTAEPDAATFKFKLKVS